MENKKSNVEDDEFATYFSKGEIIIPESKKRFSFRKLFAFTGPGLLMSIAFLDPGNIESDLQSGFEAKYKLIWVLLWATVMGVVVQRLSLRIGNVTGLHLAEHCFKHYKKFPRFVIWIMIEIGIIGTDMQAVIGTAITIYILSNKYVPLWGGTIITIIDTLTFLLLDRYGLRKLEFFFGFLIAVMAVTFGYEFAISDPDFKAMGIGAVLPWCSNCSSKAVLLAVGIVGANVAPHNLFLHSALVKSRKIDRTNSEKVKEANFYFLVESAIALLIAFIIQVFVVSVFAEGLHGKTNEDVLQQCSNKTSMFNDASLVFTGDSVSADIYKGGIFLGCAFGVAAMYIWAVGILAAGQSATMTGTYAGQFIMEGFLNLKWKRWQRVLLTRSIAIVPTFCVAFYTRLDQATKLNDYLNAVMAIQLPFAVIPTIAISSSKAIMGDFANGIISRIVVIAIAVGVIGINMYLVITLVQDFELSKGLMALVAVFGVIYLAFNAYLILHMCCQLGWKSLAKFRLIQKYVVVKQD